MRRELLLRLLHSEALWLLLEWLLALLLFVGAVALMAFRPELSGPAQALLWAAWLTAWPGLYALGFFRLLNPVLRWDLVRTARRPRHFLLRSGYATALLLVLLLLIWTQDDSFTIDARRMPEIGEVLFYGLLSVQFLALVLLTPAYTAGAIAEEKERGTLDFLLTSQLGDRDIVVGKLVARVAHLALILLAGLPILSLLQFVGGIDPNLLLAGFAAAGLTLLGLGSLSVFNSVVFARPRAAVFVTYLTTAAYLFLTTLFAALANDAQAQVFARALGMPLDDLVTIAGAGNGFLAVGWIEKEMGTGATVEDAVAPVLCNYAIFHVLVAALLTVWATAQLRPLAQPDAPGRSTGPSLAARLASRLGIRGSWLRPRLGSRPMLWKELFAEPGLKLHWFGKALLGLFVLGSFLPVAVIFNESFVTNSPLAEGMNIWLRSIGTIVMALLLLRVAVHAAGSVNGEQHRDTLVSLLTSPLGTREILFAKWLGAALGGRAGWMWLGSMLLLGVCTGGVHPLVAPLAPLAFLAYAAFVAAVGLWYSTVCQSSLTASFWTVFTVLLLWSAHWLLFLLFVTVYPWNFFGGDPTVPLVACFHALALTPPANLAFLPFSWWEVERAFTPQSDQWMVWAIFGFSLLGPVLWLLAGWLVWEVAHRRFRRQTNRDAVRPKGISSLPG